MNELDIKARHILPTFVILAFGNVIILGLLRWILSIQFSVIDIKEEVWAIWLPMALPWIPILIWLRPRTRILIFKNDNGRFVVQVFSWLTMCAMCAISQSYLTTATGKLETLNSIKEISSREKVRYYKINEFEVATKYVGIHAEASVSGKYSEHLDFSLYFVVPIVSDSSVPIIGIPKYWYGIEFHDQMSNRKSEEEKNERYKAFYEGSLSDLRRYNYKALDHFECVPKSDKQADYLKAVQSRIKSQSDDSFFILKPIEESYEGRNGNKLPWIFYSFGIGIVVIFLFIMFAGYDESELKSFRRGKKPRHDELMDSLNYLIPKGDHFITSIILDLNILFFLALTFSGINPLSPTGSELLEWGANRRYETTNGQWWRLLTSMFLHAGVMHLLLNIGGLVLAAIFVEPKLGRWRYLVLYILSGLYGSLASIWWYSNTVSVGASGAIFGLFGGILGLLLTKAFPREERSFVFSLIGVYVLINLVWGLTGGIDNAAHIGGLLSGAVIAFILFHTKNK